MSEPPYLAALEVDGWELLDAEKRHQDHPQTFWIPDLLVRQNLKIGYPAKLIFHMIANDPDMSNNIVTERMWVLVEEKVEGYYKGELDNHPAYSVGINPGDVVWFEPRHVIDVEGY